MTYKIIKKKKERCQNKINCYKESMEILNIFNRI